MPQKPLIQAPPQAPRTQLPDRPDMLSPIEHFLGVASGISEQEPGDFSDFVAGTAGVLGPGKLLNTLFKRLRGVPKAAPKPISGNADPFGLEPKMDRRQFFRRALGKNMHDTNKMLDHLDEKVHAYDPQLLDNSNNLEELLNYGLNEKEARNITATNRIWHSMMNKYWPVDNSYLDPDRGTLDSVKRFGKALGDNFENEIRQGLTHDTKEAFEKGLDEAGSGTADLINTLLKRMGIRK